MVEMKLKLISPLVRLMIASLPVEIEGMSEVFVCDRISDVRGKDESPSSREAIFPSRAKTFSKKAESSWLWLVSNLSIVRFASNTVA